MVKFSLERGANIEAKEKYGITPLFGAAIKVNTDTVALLLDRGANIEAENNDGITPLIASSFIQIISQSLLSIYSVGRSSDYLLVNGCLPPRNLM